MAFCSPVRCTQSAAFPQDRPSQERILAVAAPNNSVAWMVYVQVSCYQPLKLQHFPFDRCTFRFARWVPLGLRGGLAGAPLWAAAPINASTCCSCCRLPVGSCELGGARSTQRAKPAPPTSTRPCSFDLVVETTLQNTWGPNHPGIKLLPSSAGTTVTA